MLRAASEKADWKEKPIQLIFKEAGGTGESVFTVAHVTRHALHVRFS